MSVELDHQAAGELPKPLSRHGDDGCCSYGHDFRVTGGTCPYCKAESGVLKEERTGEKFCKWCLTVIDGANIRTITESDGADAWEQLATFRREGDRNGLTGPDRIRMAGGYPGPYDFEEDF